MNNMNRRSNKMKKLVIWIMLLMQWKICCMHKVQPKNKYTSKKERLKENCEDGSVNEKDINC